MKRSSLVLLAAVALAGCSSSPAPSSVHYETTAPREPIQGDAAHNRPPESHEQLAAAEPERSVVLPDSLELVSAPSLPARPRIAVATNVSAQI